MNQQNCPVKYGGYQKYSQMYKISSWRYKYGKSVEQRDFMWEVYNVNTSGT
jgi:hypothetical protein